MLIHSFTILVLAVTHALAAVAGRPFGCGTPPPGGQNLEMSRVLVAQESANREDPTNKTIFGPKITVSIYFHVVASSKKLVDGWLTDAMISKQYSVLRADFAPLNIAFRNVKVTRTVNALWARDGDEVGMKTALRQGTYKDLNIYILPRLVGDSLGYATFPVITALKGSAPFNRDGVSINSQTVPGGSIQRFNLGRTLTHEVGHWFGLYHTFEGGCGETGDMVADTPSQASPSSGCPKGRDSCPNLPGKDPINNYMDYSDDACYTGFTVGQRVRMAGFWHNWRGKA